MRMMIVLSALVLSLGASVSMASEAMDPHRPDPHHPGCPGHGCEEKTKDVCFNVVCYYHNPQNPPGYKSCRAAAKFQKDVTLSGGEVEDDSNVKNNPELEVSCENTVLYNNSSNRFTNLLGTRFQGQTGPFPAVLLPRGALHSGSNGSSGNHTSSSILEIDSTHGQLKAQGSCYIWTGAP